MSGYDASARREHHLWLTGQYGAVSAHLASRGDIAGAVACQLAGDTHRVAVALWGKASSSPRSREAFFELAGETMRRMARAVRRPDGAARSVVDQSRAAWQAGLEPLHVPVFFTEPRHIPPGVLVDPGEWARSALVGESWRDWVARVRTVPADAADAAYARDFVLAAIALSAGTAGDADMVTVAARWHLIRALTVGGSVQALMRTTKDVVGPVEWVRVQLFAEKVGARALVRAAA